MKIRIDVGGLSPRQTIVIRDEITMYDDVDDVEETRRQNEIVSRDRLFRDILGNKYTNCS